jgi:hypothetical protein
MFSMYSKFPEIKQYSKACTTRAREDLAKKNTEFESVGKLECLSENKMTSSSSGVYIGNQIVLTAAHCIPPFIPNNKFISSKTDNIFFRIRDKSGNYQVTRVIMVNRHPSYLNNPNGNDIAVLLITGEMKGVDPVTLDFEQKHLQHDCVSVGFSRFRSERSYDEKHILLSPTKSTKITVKIPQVFYNKSSTRLANIIGYSINNFTFNLLGLTYFKSKLPFDPLESGTYPGMSGGGLFSQNKLIGINDSGEFLKNNDGNFYSHIASEHLYFTPLFHHKIWIDQIINLYLSQLDILMETYYKWYLDREQCIAPPTNLDIPSLNKNVKENSSEKISSPFLINLSLFKRLEYPFTFLQSEKDDLTESGFLTPCVIL